MKRLAVSRYLWLLTVVSLLVVACQQAAPAPTPAPAKPAATAAPAAAPTKAPEATKPPAAAPTAAPAATKPAAATPAPTKPAAAAPPPLTKQFKGSMGTGTTAGTYYPYGGAIAGLWSRFLPSVAVTAEATGGSLENIRLLETKQAEFGLIQNDNADYAWNGTEFFKAPIKNIRGIAVLYPELIQWPVTIASGVKDIPDLKGKRFNVGPAGSGTETNTRQVFEIAGLTYNDLGRKVNLAFAEAVAAIKDRQLDGSANIGGVPLPAWTDLAASVDVRFLGISGTLASNLMGKYKFYVPATIPANSYKGQTEPVQTVAVLAVLATREDVDAEVVYWLTKTLIEKQPELAQAHAKGKDLSKDTAVKGLTIPWHPGAEKYYKEVGILK